MKGKGRQERERPINSELLSMSPLWVTGTESLWGAWETGTMHHRGKKRTRRMKELVYSSTNPSVLC